MIAGQNSSTGVVVDMSTKSDNPTGQPESEYTPVQKIKSLRQGGDALVQKAKDLSPSREISLAITKFQEGIMWLGMELKRMNEANPYPSSKDPSTGDKIEPTADGLKF